MTLTKDQRAALPDDAFAVPGRRLLPIHDAVHIKQAWGTLDGATGLTDAEKIEAADRILIAASSHDVNVDKWHRLKTSFQAAAKVEIEEPEHPNKMPFSGVLTFLDEPSDNAPGGAKGKKVVMTSAAALDAVDTLVGMGIDCTKDFDDHDVKNKIGVITSAEVVGNELRIAGHLYNADFPDECAYIKANKEQLGFSYEAQAILANLKSNPLTVSSCVFTGAAVLLKNKAAYTKTSLEASAEQQELENMDINELKGAVAEIVASTVKPLADQIATIGNDVANLKASGAAVATLTAASVLDKVKPHSDALRAAADAMASEGLGVAEGGHVDHLKKLADSMDSAAIMGRLPSRVDGYLYASAEKPAESASISAAAEKQIAELTEKVASLTTELADAKAAKFEASAEPGRQTEAAAGDKPAAANLSAAEAKTKVIKLCAAWEVEPGDDGKVDRAALADKIKAKRLDSQKAMTVKLQFKELGLL